ncbi:MAG: YHYH protein, partial [Planctomycetota bacterium]
LKSSYRLKEGRRPSGDDSPGGRYDGRFTADWEYAPGHGDLDEHNGRTGVTPEYPEGTYFYVITDAHPYLPRSFHGTPDDSFRQAGGGGGGRERGTRQRPEGERRGPPPRR